MLDFKIFVHRIHRPFCCKYFILHMVIDTKDLAQCYTPETKDVGYQTMMFFCKKITKKNDISRCSWRQNMQYSTAHYLVMQHTNVIVIHHFYHRLEHNYSQLVGSYRYLYNLGSKFLSAQAIADLSFAVFHLCSLVCDRELFDGNHFSAKATRTCLSLSVSQQDRKSVLHFLLLISLAKCLCIDTRHINTKFPNSTLVLCILPVCT